MNDVKNYAPGMYEIPEEEYHQLTYISNSNIGLIVRSPGHYYAEVLDPEREEVEPTPAMIDGRILHTAILEPHLYNDRFVVVPPDAPRKPTKAQINAKKPSPATVEAVTWWSHWSQMNEGRTILTNEKHVEFLKCAKAVRNAPDLKAFLDLDGYSEQTFIDVHKTTGLVRRCRVDRILSVEGIGTVAIDLKSTEDARPYPFSRSCYNYGYFRQASYYSDVIEGSGAMDRPDLFLFAAFEKKPPFALKLYQAVEGAMLRASLEWEAALQTAKECLDNNAWPAYSTEIESVDYPAWAKMENE